MESRILFGRACLDVQAAIYSVTEIGIVHWNTRNPKTPHLSATDAIILLDLILVVVKQVLGKVDGTI